MYDESDYWYKIMNANDQQVFSAIEGKDTKNNDNHKSKTYVFGTSRIGRVKCHRIQKLGLCGYLLMTSQKLS
jgi:hypothetical protein